MSRQAFEAFNQTFARGGANVWGIVKAEPLSYRELSWGRFQLDINLTRKPFMGELYHSTLSITFSVGSWRDFDMKRLSVAAVGSEVKTDGHPDPSLFLLQAALLGFSFNYFDEKTFANNVLRQAEKIYGVTEGTFALCKPEWIDGGIKVLMYTDNKPFNPDSGTGRGELWLTFRYDPAHVAKGFVKVSDIHQGYWSSGRWTNTDIDTKVGNQILAAEWKV
jgi:hypothetical protein